MRPVMEGLCLYESLKNGAIDLEDIAVMNDAIDIRESNQRRMQEYMESRNGR